MKIAFICLASALADQISFNRLSNNVHNHVNTPLTITKIPNIEMKLKLIAYMLNKGQATNAKELLNQVHTGKQNRKLKSRLDNYLKYQ